VADDAVESEPVSAGNNRAKYRESGILGSKNSGRHPGKPDFPGLFDLLASKK
jgi:hypothetical protein